MNETTASDKKSMRKIKSISAILLAGFCLIVAFQNFSVPEKSPEGQIDIRDLAPLRPDGFMNQRHVLQAPDQGDSMTSVGTKWLERETRPLIAPLEKEWMLAVNSRLNRFFRFEPVKSEDWPEPGQDETPGGGDRAPASEDGLPNFPKMRTLPDGSLDPDSFKDFMPQPGAYIPRNIRLTKANELTLEFTEGTDLACEFGSETSKFKLTRPLSANSSLNLSHETGENKNSMHFSLSW